MDTDRKPQADCEYIVVGSGAGGGTVAARLAEKGHTVILLEAGGDPRELKGGNSLSPENRLPADYEVPCFHAFASENQALSWDFFVRHYRDHERQKTDLKYRENWKGQRVDGVFYPRASTLGGCTAHNAMIMIYPHDADWNGIATLTGDPSWQADHMRSYFELLENCHHRTPYRWLAKLLGINCTRHGFSGWLDTEVTWKAIPMLSPDNRNLMEAVLESAREASKEIGHEFERARWAVESQGDPNDWRTDEKNSYGLRYIPLATRKHRRVGSRERVLQVREKHPRHLRIEMNALVTRVLLDQDQRALGVEYVNGERVYSPDRQPGGEAGAPQQLYASREVILAGGAFNTPQLLMLSGIGPRDELEEHGLPVIVELPGVGKNLQDRYEIGVVNRMNFERWPIFEGAKFDTTDPQYAEWKDGTGPYTTNGAALALFVRSAPERPLPDLFCVAFLGRFEGYFPTYSDMFAKNLNYLTWAVLKAHTNNRAGTVTLRSANPRVAPEINFRYFEEGTEDGGEDLDSVVKGIRFVRKMTERLKQDGLIAKEELPGEEKKTDEELREHVRANAWGHHACGSCAIGPRDQGGVLSSDFRVHGTTGLRVADASVFPRIPGFFIVSAVYMIGEKAADVILADAKRG